MDTRNVTIILSLPPLHMLLIFSSSVVAILGFHCISPLYASSRSTIAYRVAVDWLDVMCGVVPFRC